MMEDSKRVILMLSGGRDSFLAACYLLDNPEEYHLIMVTYDNGCMVGTSNAKTVAERIIQKYGADRAEYLGTIKTVGVVRRFFNNYFNMKPAEQIKEYSGLTPSQFHCLVCRTSMYIYSIWLAYKYGASFIAEGARKDQGFVIELPGMACERYSKLVREAGLELLLPVYDMDQDWNRDNELLIRGYQSKSFEPKCLIGFPMNEQADKEVIEGVHLYYDKVILPIIEKGKFLSKATAEVYLGYPYDELSEN